MVTAPLVPTETEALVNALRHGRSVEDAADDLRMSLESVWAAARADTRLTIALAGRDPDAVEEPGRRARADFLRLLALGVPAAHAELILGVGESGRWRGE